MVEPGRQLLLPYCLLVVSERRLVLLQLTGRVRPDLSSMQRIGTEHDRHGWPGPPQRGEKGPRNNNNPPHHPAREKDNLDITV